MIPTHRFDRGVVLVNLGDIHRGSDFCDVDLLHKHIEKIRTNERVYWVSTGDLLETALTSSKSSSYEADSPDVELEKLATELEPIKHKCLGFVASNHHQRVNRESGVSLDKYLAAVAGIPFLGISAVLKIVCGRAAYFISLHHGVGGGTDGNKVNRAMRLAQNTLGADIYLTGHTHTFSYVQDVQTVIDRKREKLTEITTHHVITGHYLEYNGCYAEHMGLKQKPKGCAVLHLSGNGVGNQDNKRVVVDFWGKR